MSTRGGTDLPMCKIFTYDRVYLAQARETLGAMLDYAVWDCKLDADEYFALFVTSGLAFIEPFYDRGMRPFEIVTCKIESFLSAHSFHLTLLY